MPAVTWWRSSARTNLESFGSRSPSRKAWGALGMGFGSRTLAGRAMSRSADVLHCAGGDASDGRFVPVTGGVLAWDGAGDVIGAVGISGDVHPTMTKVRRLAGIAAAWPQGVDPGVDPTSGASRPASRSIDRADVRSNARGRPLLGANSSRIAGAGLQQRHQLGPVADLHGPERARERMKKHGLGAVPACMTKTSATSPGR